MSSLATFNPNTASDVDILDAQEMLGVKPDGFFGAVSRMALAKWRIADALASPVLRTLDVIEGHAVQEHANGAVTYMGRFRIDDDGRGPSHGDPCHQRQTSYQPGGRSLNADVDLYGVVPEQIVDRVKGKVVGCRGAVLDTRTGLASECVAGDLGPKRRAGEGSIALANAVNIDSDPNTGGVDEFAFFQWVWFPGVMAA